MPIGARAWALLSCFGLSSAACGGQLGGRDATVNGLGSLLDPAKTGVPVDD